MIRIFIAYFMKEKKLKIAVCGDKVASQQKQDKDSQFRCYSV